MPTIPATCRFASVTYALPGPTMRSTAGTESVPNVMRPDRLRAARLGDERRARLPGGVQDGRGIDPSGCGGVHSTISRTPATTAGTTVMQTDDGYTARPPGT